MDRYVTEKNGRLKLTDEGRKNIAEDQYIKHADTVIDMIGSILSEDYTPEMVGKDPVGSVSVFDMKYDIDDFIKFGLNEEQIKKYMSPAFNQDQRDEILDGFEHGLIAEQVDIYANPSFKKGWMGEVRSYLEKGLTKEQIEVLSDPDLAGNTPDKKEKRRIISQGFEDGVPVEIGRTVIPGNIDNDTAEAVISAVTQGFDANEVGRLGLNDIKPGDRSAIRAVQFRSEFGLSWEDIDKIAAFGGNDEFVKTEIAKARAKGHPLDKILSAVDGDYTIDQRAEILHAIDVGVSDDGLALIRNKELDSYEMRALANSFEQGFTTEQVKVFADPRYDSAKRIMIQQGFRDGLTTEQVKLYADPRFDAFQMRAIEKELKAGLSTDKVALCANPDLTFDQMQEIIQAIRHNVTNEQLLYLADLSIPAQKMACINYAYDRNIPFDIIKKYCGSKKYDPVYLEALFTGIENNFSKEQMDFLENLENVKSHWVKSIVSGMTHGLTLRQAKICAGLQLDTAQLTEVIEGFKNGLDDEQIRYLVGHKGDPAKMTIIRDGLENGFPLDRIDIYANGNLGTYEMEALLYGLKDGFTDEQLYYMIRRTENFQDKRARLSVMENIRSGFKNGLTEGQISFCLGDDEHKYKDLQTKQLMLSFTHHVPIDKIKKYADPDITASMMATMRIAEEHGFTEAEKQFCVDVQKHYDKGGFYSSRYEHEEYLSKLTAQAMAFGISKEQISICMNLDKYAFQVTIEQLENIKLMGLDPILKKDMTFAVSCNGKTYTFEPGYAEKLDKLSYGYGNWEIFAGIIKLEALKGREFVPERDIQDAIVVNSLLHEEFADFHVDLLSETAEMDELELEEILKKNREKFAEAAKNILLGKKYFFLRYDNDCPLYSKRYLTELTDAFKKHCHGFVPKVVETVAMVGEYMKIPPEDVAKHFNVRALKQMLRGTNDWVQAYVGSQMSSDDRGRFLKNQNRYLIVKNYIDKKGNDKAKDTMTWMLRHPETSPEMLKNIAFNEDDLDLAPDTTVYEVEKQLMTVKAKGVQREIENKYKIDLDDMEYDIRHSYAKNPDNNQVARTLLKGEEPEMISLGELTCCCQEFGEAGETAMMYGLIHPEAGFWVIEDDKGKVLAQAEIWEPHNDHDTIVFDNIEFADDRDISTVMDTLVKWCEGSKYENVIMGTRYTNIDSRSFPRANGQTPALTPEDICILDRDNEDGVDYEEYDDEGGTYEEDPEYDDNYGYHENGQDINKENTMIDGIFYVKDDDNPYLYSDALKECVYLKKDGVIPQAVRDECPGKMQDRILDKDKGRDHELTAREKEMAKNYMYANLLVDARIQLKDQIPEGYHTLLDAGDDKYTVCLYKDGNTKDRIPFADVSRREDGGLNITMYGEEQCVNDIESDIADKEEEWGNNL